MLNNIFDGFPDEASASSDEHDGGHCCAMIRVVKKIGTEPVTMCVIRGHSHPYLLHIPWLHETSLSPLAIAYDQFPAVD